VTEAAAALTPPAGMTAAICASLGVSRATVSRWRTRRSAPQPILHPRPRPARALTVAQRQDVLALLHAPRFADQAPAEIYATLLDEGVYHCSIRTMYRILGHNGEVRERRRLLRHPAYRKPELLAERPNQVWSWDITKLMGPTKWCYFYLYVILDIFSRRVVGWRVADAETASLFQPLFDDAIEKHNVPPGQLTLHADRGGPMKATAFLLADLGVTKSHSRPYTSNDNPFSESHFKTLKYQPRFPKRFGCIEDAKAFCRQFFDWYNQDHHHGGIGLMTPDQVHYGKTDAVHTARQGTLDQAFRDNPERFVNKPPVPPAKPTAAWINPPRPTIRA
jgi:transposase InsO family protein